MSYPLLKALLIDEFCISDEFPDRLTESSDFLFFYQYLIKVSAAENNIWCIFIIISNELCVFFYFLCFSVHILLH